MGCDNQVGVKNIVMTFRDCDTDQEYGPLAHQLATDTQPLYRMCNYTNEQLPGGFVQRTLDVNSIEIEVIRNLAVPLSLYQGCAGVDIQVEHFNGLVYSAVNGTGTGNDGSDGHTVTLTLIFDTIDEFLPAGTIEANAALAA
jgi:hypothetical protein